MTSPSISSTYAGRCVKLAAASVAAALLVSCGGGGGSHADDDSDIGLASSSSLAQQCIEPRAGTSDVLGSADTEKAFLRSWIDETYLWYQDVRGLPAATLDPANSATPLDYFAKLKSPLTTASGKAKDQFHFTYATPEWVALSQAGVALGYGFEFAVLSNRPPRNLIVAYPDPGSPAAAGGVARGDAVLSVDGVDYVNDDSAAGVATLREGLTPTVAGATHTFTLRRVGTGAAYSVSLTAQAITSTPVQNVSTIATPTGSVGYMLFNDHIATAESQLVAAINALKAANGGTGVNDLVLDLRYNGGGYLDIASELAYMIAGPGSTSGKFFERVNYNDRNPFNQSLSERTTDFHSKGEGFSVSTSQDLPYLGLSRVFVLTSADTCSASEAIVNGLRGAGVTVNLIGGTTCGKPYGFFPKDNCDTTYFAIQFQGVNFMGFGDYADGFAPTCSVADDFSHGLGDPAENQLEVALSLRSTGTCTTPVLKHGLAKATAPTGPVLVRPPTRENRIYRER